jgi:hypothetical protein
MADDGLSRLTDDEKSALVDLGPPSSFPRLGSASLDRRLRRFADGPDQRTLPLPNRQF